MDERTLTALQQSIKKWEKRAAGEHDGKIGTDGCPLCQLFYHSACFGCPVYEKTEATCCDDTPYPDYAADRTDANAKRELDFLRSLLPPEPEKEQPKFTWVDLNYIK